MTNVLSFAVVVLVAASPQSAQETGLRNILKDASQVARRQDEHQRYWSDRALLAIADVQTRAGDFDGALETIRACRQGYGRKEEASIHLAKALAKAGQRDQAFAALRQTGSDLGWCQEWAEDEIKMHCLQYQISRGDREKARTIIDELKMPRCRVEGLRRLASAYATTGDKAEAERAIALALAASKTVPDEFDRANALWQIADAQMAGEKSKVVATIRELVKVSESFQDPTARVAALREAAVRAARISDRQTADRLFRQAIEYREAIKPPIPCPQENKISALKLIAEAQAGVGYMDDATKTARMITHSDRDFTQDGAREEALCAIAVAEAKAGRVADAVTLARSIEHYVQYKDDALSEIANVQVSHGDLKGATATAEQIPNPSKKALALLKIATAYVKRNDKETAKAIAAQIRVVARPFGFAEARSHEFDYRRPETWGYLYEPSFTMTSHYWTVEVAGDLAAAAMTFTQSLGERPSEPYAEKFKEIPWPAVVQAIARAHAAGGDARETLAWASRIGSDKKIASPDDRDTRVGVQQRIYALIGVAQGMLDFKGEDNKRGSK